MAQVNTHFEQRFRELLEEEYDEFIKTILSPQRKSFRINTNKVLNNNELVQKITSKGLNLSSVPWCDIAYFVEYNSNSRIDLGNLYEHFLGQLYIQEATSLLPPLVAQIPHPKEISDDFKVLDMCAAPGSKTTQIAGLMDNRGILIANELDYSRIAPLKLNIERSGYQNIVITNLDGTHIQGEMEYDRIILDAPCSGSGVIRKSPQTLKKYNPTKLHQVTHLQKQLFKQAVELLKPNGVLVYSTCSMDPEENECIVQWALEEFKETISIECIELRGVERRKVIRSFNGEEFDEIITKNTLRIWPHHYDTNGFFVSVFRKI
ncbi:MAG: NOL1/NOP2/sun family putative RNA methylase [Candidatus Nanoarchaeia archaeon]